MDFKKSLILAPLRFFGANLLRHLYIQPLILPKSDKIYLTAAELSDVYRISSAAKLKIYRILKSGCK